jgi:hypothetical protein
MGLLPAGLVGARTGAGVVSGGVTLVVPAAGAGRIPPVPPMPVAGAPIAAVPGAPAAPVVAAPALTVGAGATGVGTVVLGWLRSAGCVGTPGAAFGIVSGGDVELCCSDVDGDDSTGDGSGSDGTETAPVPSGADVDGLDGIVGLGIVVGVVDSGA